MYDLTNEIIKASRPFPFYFKDEEESRSCKSLVGIEKTSAKQKETANGRTQLWGQSCICPRRILALFLQQGAIVA
jgi:hypothetical protein